MHRRSPLSLRWLLAALALVACQKPKPGAPCEVGQAICEGSGTVLACQGGTYLEAPCRGPAGCTKVGTRVSCDDSVAEKGDACLEAQAAANRACGADRKTSLVCDQGKFAIAQTCRGPGGCTIQGETVTCDAKVADKGDLCAAPGTFACTPDSKARLVCKERAFAFDRYCRGATGCHPSDLACDETVSEVGDPCGVSGMAACNPEGTDELSCQGGQWVKDHPCRKSGCRVRSSGKVECL